MIRVGSNLRPRTGPDVKNLKEKKGVAAAVIDTLAALERIEDAQRQTPFCWCGAPTVAAEHRGAIWLRCSSLIPSRGVARRLLTLDLASLHTDQPILDVSELAPAA